MIKYVVAPKGRVEPFNSIAPTGQIYVVHSRPELPNTQCMFYFILFCFMHKLSKIWKCIVLVVLMYLRVHES